MSDWHRGHIPSVPPLPLDAPRLAGIATWLIGKTHSIGSAATLFEQLCVRLFAADVPLRRSVVLFSTLHPVYPGQNFFWTPDEGLSLVPRAHDFDTSPLMLRSPYRESLERGTDLRYRLSPDEDPGLPILVELRQQGFTEFLSELIPFTYGVPPGITFATTAPGGFTDEQIALLRAVPPLLAAPLEVRAQRLTTGAILDTYLGRGPGREVLDGAIQRGDLRRIDCAVLLTDLRGFTGKTERWPPETLLHALDTYFEAVADAVSTERGDVIKFVGDGVLAIFPVEAAGNTAAACKAALNAALQARDALKASNEGRSERGEEPLDFGCGLHIGEVAYGNIGGRDRLDFTVIGAAVNVASRVQELCKTLGRSLLLTADFARHVRARTISLGPHPIRGSKSEIEIFALAHPATSA
jgi:adenylate cyclase